MGGAPRGGDGGHRPRTAYVVGLTGGIATGKSTVAALLGEFGAVVLDADQVGREVLGPGEPGLAETVRHFGADMLQADGTLDRRRLGEVVFGSENARQALNRITHGRIAAALRQRVERIDREAMGPTVVVVEAALLFEAGWERFTDMTVTTRAEQNQQVQRLMERHRLDHARAVARIRSQQPASQLLARADRVIDTTGTLAETREQAESLWQLLLEAASARFARHSGALVVTSGKDAGHAHAASLIDGLD